MANGLIGKVTAGGGTHLIASTAYFTCATAAAKTTKVAAAADTSLDSITLMTGLTIYVKFTHYNSVASPTLALYKSDGTTNLVAAKPLMRFGTTVPGTNAASSWRAGAVVAFTYDGTNWVEVSSLDDNTTYSAMSVAEMRTGTATSSKTMRADYLKTFLSTLGGTALTLTHNATDGLILNHDDYVTAGTAGTSSATSGITLAVPYVTYNAQGHITEGGTHTHTIPDASTSAKGVIQIGTGASNAAAGNHTHGNITNDGKVGTAADKAVYTTTGGAVTAGTLPITAGGTGKTTAADAWTALGGGASGKHADSYFALASHGNHVPTTETANNAKFLRNDNTWQTVTPANIGAATSDHTHTTSLASDTGTTNVVSLVSTGTYKLTAGGTSVLFKIPGSIYLTSSTAAGTAAKTASYTNFSLLTGSNIYIFFSETNTQNNPTLNINNTGAKAIYYRGVRVIYQGLASGILYHMIYDGTYWQIVNDITPQIGTCTTAASTADKTVTCPGFILYTGAIVNVKFNFNSDTASLTLNVNNTGAKPVYWIGRTQNLDNKFYLNHTYEFVYDGTNYNIVGDTFYHYVTPDNATTRHETLALGNSTDYQTAGGLYGHLYLYGTGANYTEINAQANGNRSVYLPNYAGDMYLIHAQSNDAVGTSSKPVYAAANGRITQCSTIGSVTNEVWDVDFS